MSNSLFETLFSHIIKVFTSADSGGDEKRLLKNISKKLIKTNIKFYKYSSNEALPQTAKFFFDLYRIVAPAQNSFKNITNPNTLKNIVIDYHLTNEQKDLEDKFTEEVIVENAKKMPIKELTAQVKHNLAMYLQEFDNEKITMIDNAYTKLLSFVAFCNFDYYFFLKKFDTSLNEYDFTTIPKFKSIKAESVIDDLKDFTAVAWVLSLEDNWTDVLGIIKNLRGVKPIPPTTWNKVIQRLNRLKSLDIFEMMIQLIGKDLVYKTVLTNTQEHIIDSHLSKLKKTVEATLQKIQSERQNSRVDEKLNEIFGTTDVVRLKYYSNTANQSFEKKSIPGYAFYAPLNYLKAFLLDYHKKNVREFADLVLVRGQWASTALATPLSDTYHELLNISDKITEFDDELGEKGALGIKIKTYLSRADRDMDAKNILKTLIEDANERAYKMLSVSTQNFIVIAKTTKTLLEDFDRKLPEMLINWVELEHFADTPIKEHGTNVYIKIFHFVALMNFFLTKIENDE